MKNVTMPKWAFAVAETMSTSDIVNGYFGGSNLVAEYLNDYSSEAVNRFIGDFLEDNHKDMPFYYHEIINDPDYLLQYVANEFFSALEYITPGKGEYILKNASMHFEPWGKFYIFANADIACTYIIRASNECEACQELITRFEESFIVDEEDVNEETQHNDNGNPVNTDYLVLLGVIS